MGWIHQGRKLRKRRGGGTRTLDVPKESKKRDILPYAKELFFPNGKSKFGRFETFSHDILDYQEEAVLDEDVTIGELYMVLRMGVLRFYLCTKCLTDNDEESDVNNNAQHRETNEGDEQLTETLVIVSTYGKGVDDELLSDTSEVMIGPYLGEPLASQLDDTLILYINPACCLKRMS